MAMDRAIAHELPSDQALRERRRDTHGLGRGPASRLLRSPVAVPDYITPLLGALGGCAAEGCPGPQRRRVRGPRAGPASIVQLSPRGVFLGRSIFESPPRCTRGTEQLP